MEFFTKNVDRIELLTCEILKMNHTNIKNLILQTKKIEGRIGISSSADLPVINPDDRIDLSVCTKTQILSP